ncbi:MAG: SUMF1/EgtB/PvdO family nonheme iron enzyme [Chthoniobacteraceae bacterium]
MRILIVDDEADVLQAIMAIVRAVPGHDVRLAANAQKAMDHAGTLGGVDLLITDVVMEPVDGFALRAALQAEYPAMRTVFVSGYDLSDYAEQTAEAAVLQKPVDAMALITEIGKAVGHITASPKAAAPEKARVAGKTTAITLPASGTPSAQAAPVAQIVPVPPPEPAPVPAPVAIAAPVAVPTAVPVAESVQAVPKAASATPVAKVPVAQPVAVRQPEVVSPVAAPLPRAVADASSDPLIGVQVGDYRVQQFIGEGSWGRVYLALQLSVNRRVGLKVLDPARAEDEGVRAQFLAHARAKAAVQHPFIMSVFEADEHNGMAFYTHEFLDGASMEELIARGQVFDEKTALHVLKVAGEGLQYFWSHNISHAPIEAGSLRLGGDNIARMANIAIANPDPSVTVERELLIVGTILRQLTKEEAISPGLRILLGRMTGGPNPVTGWPVVLQAVKALEPKVIPVEAAKMKAADAAAMRAVEAARKSKKRGIIINVCTLTVLLALLGFVIWKYAISNARRLDMQVQIPVGRYMVGSPSEGNTPTLGTYEIDKYEVSIGEYAKFIAWCEQNQSREHEFDHPRGDRKTPHVNRDVKALILNATVRGGRVFKHDADPARKLEADPGVEVDLNSPIVAVTFWDAYAYAQWRGKIVDKDGIPRDLPTEEEWEAAARGPKGFKYPWGDELKPKNFNSNQGYSPLMPGATKTEDGYNYWAPVDKFTSDVSEFGVVGMAGNVCEWVYRKEGPNDRALLKGGSFASPPVTMWERIQKIPAEDAWYVRPAAEKKSTRMDGEAYFVGDDVTHSIRSLYIGFRTVKRK